MPLLHKQKFVPNELPQDLDPEQEVFFSKQTREIFLDYDEYFERTILCNSLVWTCSLTGKQGLTFSEALDSEKRARKHLAAFPEQLKLALIYLISLTKRGNIKSLIEDIFGFAKDRYFYGETVVMNKESQSKADLQKTCKIIDIILPGEKAPNKQTDADTSMAMDVDGAPTPSKGSMDALKINPDKIRYVLEIESKINGSTTTQTVRGPQIRRANNTLTKDKIYIIVKTYCDQKDSVWVVTEQSMDKFGVAQASYKDFFKGEPPLFDVTFGRGQFSVSTVNKSVNGSSKASSKGDNKKAESTKSKSAKEAVKSSEKKKKEREKEKQKEKERKEREREEAKLLKKQAKASAKQVVEEEPAEPEVPQERVYEVLAMKLCDMTEEDFLIWREYKSEEDLKELVLIEKEMQKVQVREQLAKEKERVKQEKLKEKQELLEAKKPKEDFDLDTLVALPKGKPVKSKINADMMGDAIFILEFLNNFGDIYELEDDFPDGFNFELLENALFSKSCDSALCNLLLFFLDSVFKCFDEETFEELEEEEESEENLALNESDDEEIGLEQLFNVPFKASMDRAHFSEAASDFLHLVKTIQGRPVKDIGLDVYTITEMLRLFFITSGAEHMSKIKFWYQQRGGYTHMDEIGIDFALNEKSILKKLETTLVYELEPEEKLKILSSLCHQLISHVRFRDLIEDNYQQMSVLKGQLRDLQTEENKRQREEASYQWKKRNEDRIREKAKLDEIKSNIPNEQVKEKTDACLESLKKVNEAEYAKFMQESNSKRELFLKRERNILSEIYEVQYKTTMYPIGKDRYYRKYWVFKSCPGVFVEDEASEQVDKLLEGRLNNKYKIETREIKEDRDEKEQKPVLNGNDSHQENQNHKSDESNQSTPALNGKENKFSDLTNLNKQSVLNGLPKTDSTSNGNGVLSHPQNGSVAMDCDAPETEMVTDYVRNEYKWTFFSRIEDIDSLIASLSERGIRESELKQNLKDLRDKIAETLKEKSPLIKNLTLTDEEIKKSIENSVNENINSVLTSNIFNNPNLNKRQMTKIAASLSVNNFAVHSSTKYLELDLRDKILDFEEQIFIGSLGTLKNTDRAKWRESLKFDNVDGDESSPDVVKKKLEILTAALLQLEQSVERRFLRTPLGEAQNTPSKKRSKPKIQEVQETPEDEEDKYQVLHNWEKSLVHCTNYSQVFVYLQTLDESIAWSKSAMNARCRLCRKKGDAEKMLLCDKCDRGHHIYCLRPQLKDIPDGQWFCPECKPKDVSQTPRKIRNYKETDDVAEPEETEESEQEDVEEEGDVEDETLDESCDESEDDKSDVSVKTKSKKASSKKAEESTADEDEESDEQEDADEDETEAEAETTQESTADENEHNDSDVGSKQNTKRSLKFNGFKIKNSKKFETDEEMTEESADDAKGRNIRKRKLTEEKNVSKTTEKFAKHKQIEVLTSSGRTTRGKKPVYAEVMSDETDEETGKKRSRKKSKLDTSRDKEDFSMNTSSRNTDVEQRLKVVGKLLSDLMKHDDGWAFLKPVSKREVPDYFDIIKKPMDFSTIKNNINNFKYDDYTSIIEDIRLVFQNCRDYNEPGSEIYDSCKRISGYFEREAKKAGLLDTKQLIAPKHKK